MNPTAEIKQDESRIASGQSDRLENEQRVAYRCELPGAAIFNIGRRVFDATVVNESSNGVLLETDRVKRIKVNRVIRVRTATGSFYGRVVRTEQAGQRLQFAVERTDEIQAKLKQGVLWGGFLRSGMQQRSWYESPTGAGLILAVAFLVLVLIWVTIWNGTPAQLFSR